MNPLLHLLTIVIVFIDEHTDQLYIPALFAALTYGALQVFRAGTYERLRDKLLVPAISMMIVHFAALMVVSSYSGHHTDDPRSSYAMVAATLASLAALVHEAFRARTRGGVVFEIMSGIVTLATPVTLLYLYYFPG